MPLLFPPFLFLLHDPLFQQGVGHGQHHRTDEEPDDAKGDKTADHAGKDQEQRQIGPLLDEELADKVVDGADEDRPGVAGFFIASTSLCSSACCSFCYLCDLRPLQAEARHQPLLIEKESKHVGLRRGG